MSDPIVSMINAITDGISRATRKTRAGPVKCAKCGAEWVNCTCDTTGITHHLLAFHDTIGGTYKVWECEDTVFVQNESERATQTIIFLPQELTRLAQMWLAMQEVDGRTHEHIFASTLDPRYEICACGEVRQAQGQE
jgi:hypothetical protein